MKNQQLADIFDRIADIMELRGDAGDKFRIISYRRAALIIRELPNDIEDICSRGVLRDIPGVGAALAEKIKSFIKTGTIPLFEELKKQYPSTIFDLLAVPHLGPKKVKILFEQLGVTNLESLEEVVKSGVVETLPGFGKKSAENILDGIALRKSVQDRRLLGEVYLLVGELLTYMKACKGVVRAEPAGSFRRKKETIGDIDILVIGKNGQEIVNYFVKYPEVKHILAQGDTKGSIILESGCQVDLRVVKNKEWGSALQYFTGSKQHNVHLRSIAKERGLKISEYGIFKDEKWLGGKTEEEIYKQLDMQYVPPEMRTDRGEIELAMKHAIPKLLELSDIRGDLHMHSNWSDGTHSVFEMARAAEARGYAYVAITDHSPHVVVANGLSSERLKKRQEDIHEARKKLKIRIFSGSEVDILADGSLDYSDTVLKGLDFVMASIHTRFGQDNTDRIMCAMENPHVHAISHISGRIIGSRDSYPLDYPKIFQKAVETGTWIEINSERLDIRDIYIHEAQTFGVKFIINTDSHHKESLWFMELGVGAARRGWLTTKDVVNCLTLKKFEEALMVKRER